MILYQVQQFRLFRADYYFFSSVPLSWCLYNINLASCSENPRQRICRGSGDEHPKSPALLLCCIKLSKKQTPFSHRSYEFVNKNKNCTKPVIQQYARRADSAGLHWFMYQNYMCCKTELLNKNSKCEYVSVAQLVSAFGC